MIIKLLKIELIISLIQRPNPSDNALKYFRNLNSMHVDENVQVERLLIAEFLENLPRGAQAAKKSHSRNEHFKNRAKAGD